MNLVDLYREVFLPPPESRSPGAADVALEMFYRAFLLSISEEQAAPALPVTLRPGGLTIHDLRDYQLPLAQRLFNDFGVKPGALLAVEMGMGKTVTTATAVRWLLDLCMVRRVLIVAPLRVAQKTWPDEFQEWEHLRCLHWKSLVGSIGQKLTPAKRKALLVEFLNDPRSEIAIINRENVVWLYKTLQELRVPWPFDMLVYDESSRLKEGKKRTGNKNLSEFGVYAKVRKDMDYVIELTGTPTPKGLIDLWGQIVVIDQGKRLGTSKTAFLSRWFEADYMGWNHTPYDHSEEEIMARIGDIMVSMKARDYIDLPPVVVNPIYVDLTPQQLKDYRRFEKELALEEFDLEAVNRGVLTGKLLQYANGSVYKTDNDVEPPTRETIHIHDHKLAALDSIVAETNGANLLVAYEFKFDLDRIKKKYPKAREATEAGALDAWNRGEVQMLLAHPASIGHGMNLQFGGHHIVWFGLNASLELFQQFNARLPRPGQKSSHVFIHWILARGTFDERLVKLLAARDATQDRITEAVKLHLLAA
ncbi:SNF2-related protein [Sulfitobacter pontiacus]